MTTEDEEKEIEDSPDRTKSEIDAAVLWAIVFGFVVLVVIGMVAIVARSD